MFVVSQLHGPAWRRVECADTGFESLSMCNNGFEVLDTDADPKLFLNRELLEI